MSVDPAPRATDTPSSSAPPSSTVPYASRTMFPDTKMSLLNLACIPQYGLSIIQLFSIIMSLAYSAKMSCGAAPKSAAL